MLDHPEVTENLKVATTLNVGEEVVSFLKTNGVSDSSLEYAKSYATSVASLTKTLRSDDSLVKKYLVASKSISKGEKFTLKNITSKRTGGGIEAKEFKKIINKRAKKNFIIDQIIRIDEK